MSIQIDWNKGTPENPGYYFVAFKAGPAAGYFDFLEWDGERWDTNTVGEVIGFIPALELKKYINIAWPEPDPETGYKKESFPDDEEDSWEEFTD
ncbi:hypothetical protein [Algicola sagamiensis]|uniref:hypothetical protein n=1 Tax=Algicola sagamiensis TaxID=163869 RepID=UPI0003660945|nr:hypothetical protein [Algicola sagamiensis]